MLVFAAVTTPESIVHTVPDDDTVMSPLSPSDTPLPPPSRASLPAANVSAVVPSIRFSGPVTLNDDKYMAITIIPSWLYLGMATYYVNGDSGTDSGANTSATPWRTIAYLIATAGTLTAGDTVYLAGQFHEYNNSWPNNVDLTIAQWPGQLQAVIVGATNLDTTGWSNTSGTTWTRNIGAGLAVGGFVSNWHDRTDANGHYGHYKLAASAAAVVGDDYSWFYATGTGLLTINVGTDASPNIAGDYDYMWVGKDLPVLQMTSSTRCTVSGIQFGLMGGTAAGSYLLYMDGTDNRAVNCRFDDGGVHNVTVGVGTNTRNGLVGCTFSGCEATGSVLAWYSSSGNVTGGYATNCTFINTSKRDPSASPIDATLSVDGVYAHTDGAGGRVISPGGVTLRGCTFTRPFSNPGNDFDHRNSAATSANPATNRAPSMVTPAASMSRSAVVAVVNWICGRPTPSPIQRTYTPALASTQPAAAVMVSTWYGSTTMTSPLLAVHWVDA